LLGGELLPAEEPKVVDDLLVLRSERSVLGHSHGLNYCVGAPLARIEM
jgi:hypothetical protein